MQKKTRGVGFCQQCGMRRRLLLTCAPIGRWGCDKHSYDPIRYAGGDGGRPRRAAKGTGTHVVHGTDYETVAAAACACGAYMLTQVKGVCAHACKWACNKCSFASLRTWSCALPTTSFHSRECRELTHVAAGLEAPAAIAAAAAAPPMVPPPVPPLASCCPAAQFAASSKAMHGPLTRPEFHEELFEAPKEQLSGFRTGQRRAEAAGLVAYMRLMCLPLPTRSIASSITSLGADQASTPRRCRDSEAMPSTSEAPVPCRADQSEPKAMGPRSTKWEFPVRRDLWYRP